MDVRYLTRKSLDTRRKLPKKLLSIKGRISNPTPLVHQDMTKKTFFYEKKERRDNSSKL